MFKYALILAVAFCAVQGFQARSGPEDRDINDVITAIKNIIEKIKDAISNIVSSIPEIIKNIHDKITEIIDNINLPGIIAKIKEEIQNIIALGEKGKKCVEAESEQLDAMVEGAQSGMQACIEAAQTEATAAKDALSKLLEEANAIREDVSSRVVKCVEDSKLNPVTLFNCLKDQVEPISEQLAQLQKQIQETIESVKEIGQQAAANLAQCAEKVRDDTLAKQEQILADIRACMDA